MIRVAPDPMLGGTVNRTHCRTRQAESRRRAKQVGLSAEYYPFSHLCATADTMERRTRWPVCEGLMARAMHVCRYIAAGLAPGPCPAMSLRDPPHTGGNRRGPLTQAVGYGPRR